VGKLSGSMWCAQGLYWCRATIAGAADVGHAAPIFCYESVLCSRLYLKAVAVQCRLLPCWQGHVPCVQAHVRCINRCLLLLHRMHRFATWSAPADAHATAPGAATAPDKPLLTKPGAAAAGAGAAAVVAAGVAAGAAAAAAGRSDEHSSTGRPSQHIRLRDKYAVSQGDEDDDTFYYQDSRPKRYSGEHRSNPSVCAPNQFLHIK
jgi:hypothetical protein